MIAKVIKNNSKEPMSVRVPASKSLSHRALIAGALAKGNSNIKNLAENKDTEATTACLKQLGAWIDSSKGDTLVCGIAGERTAEELFSGYNGSPVDCSESGSTLRFLLPLFAQSGKRCLFTGKGKLMERPQSVYKELYSKAGAEFSECPGYLAVQGKLKPGVFTLRGDVSSQFITGLMFLLPVLSEDSVIEILPPFESASYVDLTMDVLARAGIRMDYKRFKPCDGSPEAVIKVPGNQSYHAIDYTVPADWSGAAFFVALSLITGRTVRLLGADENSLQGDRAILDFARKFGARTEAGSSKESFVDIIPGELKAIDVDISDCPDLGPVLFALATQCEGTSVFRGAERLRIKESDRIGCMEEELRKLGCTISSENGTVKVTGKTIVRGGVTLKGHNDHRIVMALAVLSASAQEEVTIEGAEAITKSYPEFFKDLKNCGITVSTKEENA